ncbi:hypothetical protein D3C71_1366920 [compost metagenome]
MGVDLCLKRFQLSVFVNGLPGYHVIDQTANPYEQRVEFFRYNANFIISFYRHQFGKTGSNRMIHRANAGFNFDKCHFEHLIKKKNRKDDCRNKAKHSQKLERNPRRRESSCYAHPQV